MSSLSRRSFAKKAGRAALLATGPFVMTGLARQSPNDTMNVAVMGIRSRGRDHATTLAQLPNVNCATLCDIDERLFPKALAEVEELAAKRPKTETDIRRVLDDKDIDAISIASPNHWHALATIWACQAGKDVYVEKPVSHNISESRKMVEAARKYERIVQVGTQSRSEKVVQSAMEFLHAGKLGRLYMVKCVIFRPRESLGRKANSAVPPGVHYDLWLGPSPYRPFNENRFHYNWHWFWATGNGETGNNGPHYTDMARWALQKYDHPRRIQSMGGYDVFDSDQETPNTQLSLLEWEDETRVQIEVRGLYTNAEDGTTMGLLFFGSEGWMNLSGNKWKTYFGRKNEPGESQTATRPQGRPRNIMDTDDGVHFSNFIEAVRSRKRETLNAEILEGHLSTAMCHLSNIAYRTRRQVIFDSANEIFPGDDEANSYLTREYRHPFVVPEKV
ncbi:MAG: Gfo/Idh/MocA family oxidoreductase [Acidobacteriota bacterium]